MAAMMETEGGDDETMRKLAAGGSMDYSTWPLLLTTVVSRIEKIAHNDFPIPRIPQTITTAPPPPPEPRFLAPLPPSSDAAEPPSTSDSEVGAGSGSNNSSAVSSQETNKENAAPPDQPEAQLPTSARASEAPAALDVEPGTLPPQITAMLAEITGILNETFHTYPPHTIQRLAELVLEPRRHYKSLPSYLHAVDRVVHVTSGNNIYPLPPAIPDMSHMTINGVVDTQAQENGTGAHDAGPSLWASSSSNGVPIGSDEALGGALLTPIPWLARRAANGDTGSESGESSTLGSDGGPSPLGAAATANSGQQRQANRQFDMQVRTESTETIDGPNGVGSIETVSVINGTLSAAQQQRVITQGELIRQEQRAGVVPVSQLTRGGPVVVTSSSTSGSSAVAAGDSEADTAMDEGSGEGQGESEASKDTSSDKADEDMADEEEGPHARGPDLIGAADMGPQTPSSSTFSISSGGNPEVRGIDVEAAVGRKHEAQVPTAEGETVTQSESSDDGVILTPASTESEMAAEQQMEEATEPEGESRPKSETCEDASEETAADKEVKSKEAQTTEGTDTESSSATMTASPSPALGKRDAEDDIPETESMSSKRLKGSPERDDGAGSVEDAPKSETEAEASADDVAPEAQTASGSKEKEGETKKDDEGDIILPDQSAKAGDASTSESAPTLPADGISTSDKKEEDAEEGEAKVNEPTD